MKSEVASSTQVHLVLAGLYAGCMVAFTLMRKVKLEKYLKGHQISIAIGVGFTVLLCLLKVIDQIPMTASSVSAASFFVQGLFFTLALKQRNEADGQEVFGSIGASSIISFLFASDLWECDHYAQFVLFCLGLLLLGFGIPKARSAETPSKRVAYLWLLFAAISLFGWQVCEPSNLRWVLAIVGVLDLLIVKINHPVFGDSLDAPGSATSGGDIESSAWRM